MQKFTFKTEKATGQYRSFFPDHHHIKFNKIDVGSIDDKFPFAIRLQVYKKDILEDGNPNCEWRWITLKKESFSLQEAKDFLNEHIDDLFNKYSIYIKE